MGTMGGGREAQAVCLPPAPQGPREHVLWEAVSGGARGRRSRIPHPPPVFLTLEKQKPPERVHSAQNKSKGRGGLQRGVKRGPCFPWAQGKGGNQTPNGASGFLRRCRSSQQPKPHLPPPCSNTFKLHGAQKTRPGHFSLGDPQSQGRWGRGGMQASKPGHLPSRLGLQPERPDCRPGEWMGRT